MAFPNAPLDTSILAYGPFFPNGQINDAWSTYFTSLAAVLTSGPVTSFNNRFGVVTPTTGDYTVAQITGAAPTASPTFTGTVSLGGATVTGLGVAEVTGAAPLNSPTFTGTVSLGGATVTGLDATEVTFTQTGTGASASTVNAQLNEIVSLLNFGAVGDGATDDTTAVQAALDSGAKRVYVPAKTFIVTSVAVPIGVTLCGYGSSSILKQKTGTAQSTSVITVGSGGAGVSGVVIRDLAIDGNGANVTSGQHNHGIQIVDSTDVKVLNCTVHDMCGDAITFWSSTDAILCQRITVTGNTIYNLGRQGICSAQYGARNVIVGQNSIRTGIYVVGCTSNGNGIHFEIDVQPDVYVGDTTIVGNSLTESGISIGGSYSGISITGNTIRSPQATSSTSGAITVTSASDASVIGNTIYGDNTQAMDGIYVQNGNLTYPLRNITISGNSIDGIKGTGINILSTQTNSPGDVNVTGNTIRNITGTTKDGIYFQSNLLNPIISSNTIDTVTGYGIHMQSVTGGIVLGNRIIEAANARGISIGTGTSAPGPILVVANSISWATTAGTTGVYSASGSNRVVVIGNDLADTGTPINFVATNNNPTGVANVTGNASATGSFTLAAAATTTVSNVNVTATSRILLFPTNAAAATLQGSAKCLYISARTAATGFTVATASAAAAGGTETFDYWIA